MVTEKQIFKIEDLNEALVILLDGKDFSLGLEKACRFIGRHLGGEYLFLLKTSREVPEKMGLDVRFALRNEEEDWEVTPSPVEGHMTVDAPLSRKWVKSYEKGKVFKGSLAYYKGESRSKLQSIGVDYFIHIPLRVDSISWGLLTLTSRKVEDNWNSSQINMIKPLLLAIGNILARKMVEDELKSQRDYLREVIDHIPSLIFAKDVEGRYIMANKSAAKAYGTTPEELIGKSDLDLNKNKEEVGQFQESDLKVIHSAQPLFVPSESFTHASGETRIYQTVKVPLKNNKGIVRDLMGIAMDITYQKEIEKRIEEEKHLLEAITGTTPDLIILFDLKKDKIIYSNLNGQFLGYDLLQSETPIGFFEKIVHPSEYFIAVDDFFKRLEKAKENETIEVEFRLKHANQNWIWFNKRCKVFKREEDGSVSQFITFLQNINEKKENEAKILESEQRYRNFIKYSTDGIYYMNCEIPIPVDLPAEEQVDLYYKGGVIEESNIALAKMYGYEDPEDLIGKRIANMHAGEFLESNKESFREFIQQGYRVENVETIESDLEGNKKIFFNQAVGVIKDRHVIGIWGTQQDITSKRMVMEALKESEALQKAALKALPDVKFRVNKEGVFTDIYPSTTPIAGIYAHPEKFLNKSIDDMMPAYLAKGMTYNLQKALATKEVQRFEYALSAGGKLAYFEARLSAIDKKEVIIVIRDISERKKFQEALQEKYRELDLKNRQLQKYIDSNMQLENFAYIASHDLREPIRTMRTFAQLLQKRYEGQLDEAAQSYLGFIVDSAHNMNQLIEDLLTYSRVNTEELVFEQINPNKILQETLKDLGNVIKQKDAIIHIEGIPDSIRGNLTRMKQLFQNLVANAIKFSRLDQPPVVNIQARDTGIYWQFVVKDNGIGIEEEFFEKIFLLFKKLHSRKDFHGTGIGLALCKKIVVQHGGEIWVESTPGKGTSFHFTISKQL